jgi:hypothetical protein
MSKPSHTPLFFDSYESLLNIARAVRDLSGTFDDEEKVALAWTLRNRMSGKAGDAKAEALVVSGGPSCPGELSDPRLAQAIELVTAVWLGEIPDPTNGATVCHRHDITPPWTKFRKVKALIGQQLFYS